MLEVGNIVFDLSSLSHLFRYLGLGLFTFMSGYLLAGKNLNIKKTAGALEFMARRFRKIYPLYWVALIVYVLMFSVYADLSMDTVNLIAHILGGQLFYGEPLPTLWYVGLIITFYLLFTLVSLAEDKKWGYIVSFIIFLGLVVAKVVYPKLDIRLIIYWPIFSLAMSFAGSLPYFTIIRVSLAAFVFAIASFFYLELFSAPEKLGISAAFFQASLLLWVVMASFVYIVYYICNVCSRRFSFRFKRYTYLVAYSSFAIYLFHRPFYQLCKTILSTLGLYDDILYRSTAVLVTSVALLLFSFAITRGMERLTKPHSSPSRLS